MTNAAFETTLSQLLDAPRIGSITVSKDRILATVQQLKHDGSGYVTQLWDVTDTPVQLTNADDSVSAVAPSNDGRIFFLSSRDTAAADPEAPSEAGANLWVMPLMGEPYVVAQRTWGFQELKVVEQHLVVAMQWHTAATTADEHEEFAKTRDDAKVSGVLYTQFPTRSWDQDLPHGRTVLAVAPLPAPGAEPEFTRVELPEGRLEHWDVTSDGTRALVTMSQQRGNTPATVQTSVVYRIDLGTGETTELLTSTPQTEYSGGAISPDGTRAVISVSTPWRAGVNLSVTTAIMDMHSGQLTPLWSQLDRWVSPEWLTGTVLVAATDDEGAGAIYVGEVNDPAPQRVTTTINTWQPNEHLENARFYGPVTTDPTANTNTAAVVYAVTSGIAASPQLVKLKLNPTAPEVVEPVVVDTPAPALVSPGRLTTVSTTVDDGTTVRSWLRLPDGEGPFPMVVFVHGGPWGSWNAWTYRWNPDPFVAAGYAVLLPDPAISTGYGQAMIDRGDQQLGGTPYTDLLALIDTAGERNDIDPAKTALAGGSYGGYMAN